MNDSEIWASRVYYVEDIWVCWPWTCQGHFGSFTCSALFSKLEYMYSSLEWGMHMNTVHGECIFAYWDRVQYYSFSPIITPFLSLNLSLSLGLYRWNCVLDICVQGTVKVPFEVTLLIEASVGLEGHSLVEHVCIKIQQRKSNWVRTPWCKTLTALWVPVTKVRKLLIQY